MADKSEFLLNLKKISEKGEANFLIVKFLVVQLALLLGLSESGQTTIEICFGRPRNGILKIKKFKLDNKTSSKLDKSKNFRKQLTFFNPCAFWFKGTHHLSSSFSFKMS